MLVDNIYNPDVANFLDSLFQQVIRSESGDDHIHLLPSLHKASICCL